MLLSFNFILPGSEKRLKRKAINYFSGLTSSDDLKAPFVFVSFLEETEVKNGWKFIKHTAKEFHLSKYPRTFLIGIET